MSYYRLLGPASPRDNAYIHGVDGHVTAFHATPPLRRLLASSIRASGRRSISFAQAADGINIGRLPMTTCYRRLLPEHDAECQFAQPPRRLLKVSHNVTDLLCPAIAACRLRGAYASAIAAAQSSTFATSESRI
jgi:hypothetical protein